MTARAQAFIADRVAPESWVIDATLGAGRDCLFLARQLGERGRVFAFDIQSEAIRLGQQRLLQAGLLARVEWIADCHSQIHKHLQGHPIAAAMFNLGYLPGGDKTITTTPTSSLQALQQCLDLLHPGGGVSIIAYTGHPGGQQEADAVQDWANRLPRQDYSLACHQPKGAKAAPLLLCIERKGVRSRF